MARLATALNCPSLRPSWPLTARSIPILWLSGMNKCWPILKINNQMSITEKPGDPNPISNMPKAHNRLATKASLREHRKKKSAAKKTTRNPGNSLGNSRKPRCQSLIKNVSLRKLLNVESTILWENPKTNVAVRNNLKSRGKSDNLFLICPKMLCTCLLEHYHLSKIPGNTITQKRQQVQPAAVSFIAK